MPASDEAEDKDFERWFAANGPPPRTSQDYTADNTAEIAKYTSKTLDEVSHIAIAINEHSERVLAPQLRRLEEIAALLKQILYALIGIAAIIVFVAIRFGR